MTRYNWIWRMPMTMVLILITGCSVSSLDEVAIQPEMAVTQSSEVEMIEPQETLMVSQRSLVNEDVLCITNLLFSQLNAFQNTLQASDPQMLAQAGDTLTDMPLNPGYQMLAQAGSSNSLPGGGILEDLPINVVPGECYARCLKPSVYDEYTEQVLVREGGEEIDVTNAQLVDEVIEVVTEDASEIVELIPAQYATEQEHFQAGEMLKEYAVTSPVYGAGVSDDVLIAEGYKEIQVIPAQFRSESKSMMTKAASKRVEIIPAQFDQEPMQVVVKDASKELRIIPAEFGWEEEQVLVSDSYEDLVVVSQPVYDWTEEQVLVKDASTELRVIPAEFTWETKDVMVKEAGEKIEIVRQPQYETRTRKLAVHEKAERLRVIPAQYDWVEEQVMVSPAYTVYDVRQAEYDTVTEQVQTAPAVLKWVRSKGCDPQSANDPTCDIVCVEESPAQYETVTKKMLRQAASVIPREVPAQYETVRKRVMVQPPRVETVDISDCEECQDLDAPFANISEKVMVADVETRTVPIRPEYATIKVKVVTSPARVEEFAIPAQYQTVRVQKLVKDAVIDRTMIPAQYQTVKKQVMVTPPQVKEIVIPAEYAVVQKQVVARPASVREAEFDAEYTTINQQMLVQDATYDTVAIPAQYQSVEVQKLIVPAELTVSEMPQSGQTYEKRVLVSPETYETVRIPGKSRPLTVKRLLADATVNRRQIKEEYDTITKMTEKQKGGQLVWRRVLCEVNMTIDTIFAVQAALLEAGFDPGPLDGQYGGQTQRAIREFQKANNLPGGPLTLETLEALGLDL